MDATSLTAKSGVGHRLPVTGDRGPKLPLSRYFT
jgi:hypothetical protein